MHLLLVLMTLAQTGAQPGPLDAFRANYAAIKMEIGFAFEAGLIDSAIIRDGRIWSGLEFPLSDVRPGHQVVGVWACDGETEYYLSGSPDSVIAEARKKPDPSAPKTGYVVLGYRPKVEDLFDGEVLAGHYVDEPRASTPPDTVAVWKGKGFDLGTRGKGAFTWWEYPFPYILGARYLDVRPRRIRASWGGNETEIEVYRKETPSGWLQLEVAYDPAIGYVPRHTRQVSFGRAGDSYVREIFVVRAEACRNGGFVPLEWYAAIYRFGNLESEFPGYDETMVLAPREKQVGVEHFRATYRKDIKGPVGLTQLKGVRRIDASGGSVRLASTPSILTLADVRGRLGRKLTDPVAAPLPTIDAAELHEFDRPRQNGWIWALAAALIISAISGIVLWRRVARRAAVVLILAVGAGLPGCGGMSEPVLKLTGGFRDPTFLVDGPGPLEMHLLVRNDSNRRLRILHVDGGCSCRKVDQSIFPRELSPGDGLDVRFTYDFGRASNPVNAVFTFQSNYGQLSLPVVFYPLVRHQLDPEAPSHLSVGEQGDWTFELTHRAIFRDGEGEEPADLFVPKGFEAHEAVGRRSRVVGTTDLSYKDTIYRVTLKSKDMGLHKELAVLVGRDGSKLAEASLVWKRVPYLSTVPDRVSLGKGAVRVFLRCPDEGVELTSVLSAPQSVKAVVSSPRELTVMPSGSPDEPINGLIEVGTTARDRPPLRVPVVRYVAERSIAQHSGKSAK